MKEFGDYLLRSYRWYPDWSGYYLNYTELKETLLFYSRRRKRLRRLLSDIDNVTRETLTHIEDCTSIKISGLIKTPSFERRRQQKTKKRRTRRGDGSDSGSCCTSASDETSGSDRVEGVGGCEIMDDDREDGHQEGCGYYIFHDDLEKESRIYNVEELMHRVCSIERSQFTDLLDSQFSHTASFYTSQLHRLSRSIAVLSSSSSSPTAAATSVSDRHASSSSYTPPSPTHTDYDDADSAYILVGHEILELLAFVVVNVVTLRHVLIRYDEFVTTYYHGVPLSHWYLKTRGRGPHWGEFFRLTELQEVERTFYERLMSITRQRRDARRRRRRKLRRSRQQSQRRETLDSVLSEERMRDLEEGREERDDDAITDVDDMDDDEDSDGDDACLAYYDEFSRQYVMFVRILNNTLSRTPGDNDIVMQQIASEAADDDSSSSREGMTSLLVSKIRHWFLLGSMMANLSLEPKFADGRCGRKFRKEIKIITKWRETNDLCLEYGVEDDYDVQVDPENVWPLILNCLSCFLHMMNFYIIKPTSTAYIISLGGRAAYSGLLIGAMVWASLVSAVMYSFWTNYSYRQPILFAGLVDCLGNYMYASAYHKHSITMVMVGCACIGLGNSVLINRRFLAEKTPFALRTPANVTFAAVAAVGAAMGPAIVIAFDNVDEKFEVPVLGVVHLNGLTGPGYFMSGLWFIYLLVMTFTFSEPIRGLKQKKVDPDDDNSNNSTTAVRTLAHKFIQERHGHQTTPTKKPAITINTEKQHTLDSIIDETTTRTAPMTPHLPATPTKKEPPSPCPPSPRHQLKQPPPSTASSSSDSHDSHLLDLDPDLLRDHLPTPPTTPSKSTPPTSPSSPLVPPTNDNDPVTYPHSVLINPDHHILLLIASLIFINMFVLEILESSNSVLASRRYMWQVKDVAALQVFYGLLVIPVSIIIGWMSQQTSDKLLLSWLLLIATASVMLLIDLSDVLMETTRSNTFNKGEWLAVGPLRYIAGGLSLFVCLQACESVVASMFSKVCPQSMARGMFNSSFLSTIVGTLGRAVADVFITMAGLISIRNLMNSLFLPSFLLLICSNFIVREIRYRVRV